MWRSIRIGALVLLAISAATWTSSCRTALPGAAHSETAATFDSVVVGESARPVGLHRNWGSGLLTLDAAVIGVNRHSQRAKLVVDSGAEISGLLESVAIGLPEGQERIEVRTLHGGNLDGMTVSAGIFPWPGVSDPGVLESMPETSLVVFPGSANLPGRSNGLLGADFLLSEKIAVDIGGARLMPSPASVPAPRGSWVRLDLLTGAGPESPLRFLKMSIGGETLVWLVDCGAERSLLRREAVVRLGIRESRSGQNTELVDAGGERVFLGYVKLKNARWGAHSFRSLVVGVAPMGNLRRMRVSGGRPVDGVLGFDFLELHSAIIDLPARALWVRLP